jgi:AcrR family transcriptional regulator
MAERDVKRERICEAMIDLVLERGFEATTVEALVGRAGVRRADFERHFAGKEECVLAIIDTETDRFIKTVFSAYEQHSLWRDGMRAAAYAAARFVRDNTPYIRFSTVMMNGATDLARTHRDMSFQLFAEIIDAGRQELDDPDSVSPETALTVIGSIVQLIFREVGRHGGTAEAESFVPELMYQAVRPYLGNAEALKELSIPPPPGNDPQG